MGVPAVWQDGSVGSWGSASSARGGTAEDRYHMTNTALRFRRFRVRKDIPAIDVLSWQSSPTTALQNLAGIYTWQVDLEALWPRATPRLGNSGFITFGTAGYATNMLRYNLNITSEVHAWVPLTGSVVKTPYARPGVGSWGGSYTALVDATTSINAGPDPGDMGTAAGTATFKLTEDGTDPTLAGAIVVTGWEVEAQRGNQTEIRYDFVGTGDLTAVAGSSLANILPARVAFPFDWDADSDGVPDGTLTCTAVTGKTYSGPAFISSIALTCDPSQPIQVNVTAQGAGALAVA